MLFRMPSLEQTLIFLNIDSLLSYYAPEFKEINIDNVSTWMENIQFIRRIVKEFQLLQLSRILEEHNGLFRNINNTINTHD